MNKTLNKLFFLNAWGIAWRKLDDRNDSLPIGNNCKIYNTLPSEDRFYYADPFVVEDGLDVYLFAESMDRYRGKGTISVSRFDGKNFGGFTEIVKEDFHLSYPNVFLYDGHYYMLPECSEIKQIRLYEAVSFPYKWKLSSILKDDGHSYVDTSLEIIDDNKYVLYSTYLEGGRNHVKKYNLDMKVKIITECNAKGTIPERSAGNPIRIDNNYYRPTQNCSNYYGEAIFIYEYGEDEYSRLKGEITTDSLILKPDISNITGTHTINRSKNYEVIDYRFDKFCISKPWMTLYKKLMLP